MVEYFREGGFSMWLLLATFVLISVLAVIRPRVSRPTILMAGVIAELIEGMFGLATGMVAVSRHAGHFPDPAAAIAEGLGELANNGTFAAGLATILGVAALLTGHAASRET